MAARRTVEWIGMFKAWLVLDMKCQTCFSKAVMQNLVRKPGYAASCGASKSTGRLHVSQYTPYPLALIITDVTTTQNLTT